jgi:hypothetical protein
MQSSSCFCTIWEAKQNSRLDRSSRVDKVSNNMGKRFNGSFGENVSKARLSSQELSSDLVSSPLACVL